MFEITQDGDFVKCPKCHQDHIINGSISSIVKNCGNKNADLVFDFITGENGAELVIYLFKDRNGKLWIQRRFNGNIVLAIEGTDSYNNVFDNALTMSEGFVDITANKLEYQKESTAKLRSFK